MIQPGPEFDSVFRYIVVVAQRAEQLISGARVRSGSRRAKPTLQALDDVDAGMVSWRVLTQEELDAQRQAIVEQFRAEVGADRIPVEASPRLRDVLPTGPVEPHREPVETVTEERDDELSRLQRLLGLTGGLSVVEEDVDSTLEREGEETLALDLDEVEVGLEEEEDEEKEARDELVDDGGEDVDDEGGYVDEALDSDDKDEEEEVGYVDDGDPDQDEDEED